MKNLLDHAEQCMNILDSLNIPFHRPAKWTVNNRAKSRWGRCEYNRATKQFEVQINGVLLEDMHSDDSLHTTILHELLHTVPDGMDHTGNWKRYAEKVNRATGLHISRTETAAEKGIEESYTRRPRSYKYELRCNSCGRTWKYQKRTFAIQHPDQCWCQYCGRHKSELIVKSI